MRNIIIGILLASTSIFASDTSRKLIINKEVIDVKTYQITSVNQNSVLVLKDEVEDWNMNILSEQLVTKASKYRLIYLVIDSPGGSISAGLNFINTMKAVKAKKGTFIRCVITDRAYSMAAFIQSYCSQTLVLNNATIMYHQASYGVSGSAHKIRTQVSFVERYLAVIEENLAIQMGMDYQEYLEFRGTEVWLTSMEAANSGIVDGILVDFYYTAEAPEPRGNSGTMPWGDTSEDSDEEDTFELPGIDIIMECK